MIPLAATVRIHHHPHWQGRHLWIPLSLVWLLLLPVMLLLSPLFLLVCLVTLINPLDAIKVLWEILSSLRDTHVEVQRQNASVLVHIL